MFRRKSVASVSMLLAFTASVACSSGEASPPSPGISTASGAVLDWDGASITLPLDGFGMTLDEQRTVAAARSIVFARCALGKDDVGDWVIEQARQGLIPTLPDANATHWLFGFWDAPFISQHGWVPLPSGPMAPQYVQTDEATGQVCAVNEDVTGLNPINISELNSPGSVLVKYSFDAYEQTISDPRFVRLRESVSACVSSQGYTIDPQSDLGSAVIDPTWTDEMMLASAVAQAGCRDQLGATQQAGDIAAEYQNAQISAHEAELVAVKQLADDRVAKATEILRTVGLA